LGPGLSQSDTAKDIVDYVLNNAEIPVIMDADALNIVSKDISVLKRYSSTVIITPHIGEMTRLTGMSSEKIKADRMKAASDFAQDNNVIVVMKDAVTVVAEDNSGERMYINTSGTPAMAKAGLGDVLTGVIAGMYMLGIEPYSAAAMGTYLHGMAGELAAYDMGEHSVMATDVVDCISRVLNTNKGS
jgi:NAD(P)H-hydrate epimerase